MFESFGRWSGAGKSLTLLLAFVVNPLRGKSGFDRDVQQDRRALEVQRTTVASGRRPLLQERGLKRLPGGVRQFVDATGRKAERGLKLENRCAVSCARGQ